MDVPYQPVRSVTPEGATIITMNAPHHTGGEKGLIGGMVELKFGAILGNKMVPEGEGLPHFLEHILSSGSSKLYPRKEAMRFCAEDLGVQYNAMTSYFVTSYMQGMASDGGLVVVEEDFWKVFEAIGSGVFYPRLTATDIKAERTRVFNEIPDANTPREWVQRRINAHMFTEPGLGLSDIGSREQLATYTPDVVRDFHKQAYVQSNALFTLVGDIQHAEAVEKIRTFLRDVPAGKPVAELAPISVRSGEARELLENDGNASVTASLYFARPAYSTHDEKIAYGRVMEIVSDLFYDKIEKEFGIYNVRFALRNGLTPNYCMRLSADSVSLVNKAALSCVDYLYSDAIKDKIVQKAGKDLKTYEVEMRTSQPRVEEEALRLSSLEVCHLPLLSEQEWLSCVKSQTLEAMARQFEAQKKQPLFVWASAVDSRSLDKVVTLEKLDALRGYRAAPVRPKAAQAESVQGLVLR